MTTTALQTTNDNSNIANILFDNLGGALSANDLLRVKMPSGGGIAFEVPTEGGEVDYVKAIVGVIVAQSPLRQYFAKVDDKNRLLCTSSDGVRGKGEPGGSCATCRFNQWKSSEKGNGKACAEKIALYVMREDDFLPIYIALPPTSLAPFRKYMVDLLLKRIPFYDVRTKLTLKKVEVTGRDPYSVVQFAIAETLDADTTAMNRAFRESFLPLIAQAAQAKEPEEPATVVESFTLNSDGTVTDPSNGITF